MKKSKIFIFLISALTTTILVFVAVRAFTGPGSNQPPNGSPTFWQLNGTSMYYSGGNVGIGTVSPNSLLHINGATPSITLHNSSGTANTRRFREQVVDNAGSGEWHLDALNDANVNQRNIIFANWGGQVGFGGISGSNKVSVRGNMTVGVDYIDAGSTAPDSGLLVEGNVGIGTTSPNKLLEVYTNTAAPTTVLRLSNAHTSGYTAGLEFWSGYSGGMIDSIRGGGGTLYFTTNGTLAMQIQGGALMIGSGGATGGFKGDGTINVAGDIYKNGTAYTNPDYVFEKYFTGNIIKFKDKDGASTYTGVRSLDDVKDFVSKNYQLPLMASSTGGIFGKGDAFLASLEESYLYLFNHESRIKTLESTVQVQQGEINNLKQIVCADHPDNKICSQ